MKYRVEIFELNDEYANQVYKQEFKDLDVNGFIASLNETDREAPVIKQTTTNQYAELTAIEEAYSEGVNDAMDTAGITRLEVIDRTGRVYVNGPNPNKSISVDLSKQDGGKTLKIFVEDE